MKYKAIFGSPGEEGRETPKSLLGDQHSIIIMLIAN